MHDCFISFSSKDKKTTTAILKALEQQNIRCWISFRDAKPGQDYALSIVRAIKSAKCFILILSDNSMKSYHVLNEINSAVNNNKTILPFRIDQTPLSEGMEYYIGKIHWIDATHPPLNRHVEKLVKSIIPQTDSNKSDVAASTAVFRLPFLANIDLRKALNKNKGTFNPKPHLSSKKNSATDNELKAAIEAKPTIRPLCKMVKYQDLLTLGYTSKTVSLQLVENDYINCNGIGLENEGTAMQWETFLQNNSDTFQYLINENNEIVGNWSIVALDESTFEKATNGDLLEVDISVENTEMICFPGYYNGYILVFSLLPEYRITDNYNLVIRSFFKQIETYAQNGIFFKQWCINVFGKEVEALIKQLGFTYLTDNKVFGKIYYLNFIPLPKIPLLQHYPDLINYYGGN